MSEQEVSPSELHAALSEVAALLASRGRSAAKEVHRAAIESLDGDPHGARRYLAINRAILDISFSSLNGDSNDEARNKADNEMLGSLHSRAFALATVVERAHR